MNDGAFCYKIDKLLLFLITPGIIELLDSTFVIIARFVDQ